MLGNVYDVMLVEAGDKEERHVKILVELDLTKPLLRGTRLKYKQIEILVEFKYEQLPMFCFYCGIIGYNERMCSKRKPNISTDCVLKDQFSHWLRLGGKNIEERGYRGSDSGRKNMNTEMPARSIMFGDDKGGDNMKKHVQSKGDRMKSASS